MLGHPGTPHTGLLCGGGGRLVEAVAARKIEASEASRLNAVVILLVCVDRWGPVVSHIEDHLHVVG